MIKFRNIDMADVSIAPAATDPHAAWCNLIPIMTTTNIAVMDDALDTTHEGVLIYDSTVNKLKQWNGAAWETYQTDVPGSTDFIVGASKWLPASAFGLGTGSSTQTTYQGGTAWDMLSGTSTPSSIEGNFAIEYPFTGTRNIYAEIHWYNYHESDVGKCKWKIFHGAIVTGTGASTPAYTAGDTATSSGTAGIIKAAITRTTATLALAGLSTGALQGIHLHKLTGTGTEPHHFVGIRLLQA